MAHLSAKRLYIGSPGVTLSAVSSSYDIVFDVGIFEVVSAEHIAVNYLGSMVFSGHIASNSLRAAVQADHSAGNAILVSADHVSSFSLSVSSVHITAYDVGIFTGVAADHTAVHSIRQAVFNNHASVFDIIYIPTAEHTAVYSIRQGVSADYIFRNALRIKIKAAHTSINTFFISGDHDGKNRIGFLSRDVRFIWSLNPAIACNFTSRNTIFQQSVNQSFTILNSGLISKSTVHLYSIKSEARLDFVSKNLLAFSLKSELAAKFDLLHRNPVFADKIFPYVLSFETEKKQNSISSIINSRNINLLSLEIFSDENSYCISLAADIADMESWMLCEPGLEIEITINAILYRFLIDSRERSLEFGKEIYSISGRSMTARLGTGYAEPITKTWPATTALAIVDELCTAAGVSYTCSIADWNLTEELFAVESLFPIQILKKLTDAAGAILQSTPAGELLIQYLYPVPPPSYKTASPDLVISGAENIFSLVETKEIKSKWNAVLVMDEPESADQYSIEVVSENNGIITLAVWAFPFVDEILFNNSYLLPSVSIWEDGLTIEEKEETIEIVQGNGSVSKPVLSVVKISYENSTDLGSVSVDGTKITTATKGQSLLKIKYNTQYFKIRVQNTNLDKVQFFIENAA